jgi:hypothetical protein
MPRCVICDYSSDVDSGKPRKVEWDDEEKGYVCAECRDVIGETRNGYGDDELDPDLGGLAYLDVTGLEELEGEVPSDTSGGWDNETDVEDGIPAIDRDTS